jgi:hypothetical protein
MHICEEYQKFTDLCSFVANVLYVVLHLPEDGVNYDQL